MAATAMAAPHCGGWKQSPRKRGGRKQRILARIFLAVPWYTAVGACPRRAALLRLPTREYTNREVKSLSRCRQTLAQVNGSGSCPCTFGCTQAQSEMEVLPVKFPWHPTELL
ncbi:unnamed protein product [Urochloa humidicola]